MEELDSVKKRVIENFEKKIENFNRYYIRFNNSYFRATTENLKKQDHQLTLLREAINYLLKNQSLYELNAKKIDMQTYDTIIKKSEDYYESSRTFITLREVLLYPTNDERKILEDAYDSGWNDYREIIYNCHQLEGEPFTMEEIIDWGPEWYDIGPLEDS